MEEALQREAGPRGSSHVPAASMMPASSPESVLALSLSPSRVGSLPSSHLLRVCLPTQTLAGLNRH